MNIMCPVSCVKAAELFAKMGAKEIYVGVSCEEFGMKLVTFTGRTNKLCTGENVQLSDFHELKKVVKICHDNNMLVNFTANVRNLSENLKEEYLEYVDKAVRCGVDAIIVGSILGLILLKDKYSIPLHASTFFYPFNKYNVDFFNEFGVKRIILPTALSISEIEEIIKYIDEKGYDMTVEVFGHFGCSNINGRCNIFNDPPSICRGQYTVYDKNNQIIAKNISLIDAGKDCTICSIKELERIGVTSLKIMGRGLSLKLIGTLVKIYCEALKQTDKDSSYIREEVLNIASWWEQSYCNEQRCMYRRTDITKYYI